MMYVEKKSQKDLSSFEMFFPPKSQSIKLHKLASHMNLQPASVSSNQFLQITGLRTEKWRNWGREVYGLKHCQ